MLRLIEGRRKILNLTSETDGLEEEYNHEPETANSLDNLIRPDPDQTVSLIKSSQAPKKEQTKGKIAKIEEEENDDDTGFILDGDSEAFLGFVCFCFSFFVLYGVMMPAKLAG